MLAGDMRFNSVRVQAFAVVLTYRSLAVESDLLFFG